MARILVVDDSEDSRYALGLQLGDHEVSEAGSGAEALAMATENPPDCILLDVEMPGMSGFDTCRALRDEPATAAVPVILVTGHRRDTDSLVAGIAAGADEYITKPVAREELQARVRAMLRVGDLQRRLREANAELEGEVRRRTADLKRIYETVPVGLYTLDPQGVITAVNRHLKTMLAYDKDELVGRSVGVLFADGYDAEYWTALCCETGRFATETSARRREGEDLPVFDERVLNADGSGFTGYLQDLSQRQWLVKVLQEQETQAAVGRLAAGIVHEIINPLSGVQQYLGAIGGRLEREDTVEPAELQRGLSVMSDAIERATALVGNLRGFTRSAARKTQLVDPFALLEDLSVLMRHDLHRRGISMELAGQGGGHTVAGDAGRISQILLNLITNARDAMPDGGVLTASVASDDDWAEIRVKDTGVGIDPADRARVFDLLFTTKGESGTGYGLAISRRIAADHGGTLDFEANPGPGTTFLLRLPKA
ncbi:MAG: response regulator [Planctomycetota bacterium]|nr:response regulator [Planctomycetota bacterium]